MSPGPPAPPAGSGPRGRWVAWGVATVRAVRLPAHAPARGCRRRSRWACRSRAWSTRAWTSGIRCCTRPVSSASV